MKLLKITVRTSDPITKEFISCDDYELEVSSKFDTKEPNYHYILYALIRDYPDSFPTEEPGVDMEITNIEIIGDY